MSRTPKSVGLVILFICYFLASGTFVTPCLGAVRQPLVVISEIGQSPAKIFAGETFTENLNLTNVGNEKARMVQLSLNISYPFLIMGSSSTFFVGDLKPNEIRSISMEILVDKDAGGLYHIGFTIRYRDDDGWSYTDSGTFGVQIFGRPEIDIREVVVGQSSPRIFAGETFTKIFNLTNAGNDKVKMVQLSIETSYPFSVVEPSSNFFVGDLDPGESRPVSVEILVDENAIGFYYIQFTIGYKDGDGETYTQSGAFVVEVFGRPEIDIREVVVGQSPSKIFAGDTFTECFNLTNLGAREAKMVHFSLNITYPFAMAETSSDLFVGDLEAGESRSISVEILVDKNAVVGVYSIPLAIRYQDSNRESYTKSGTFGVEILGKPQLHIGEIIVDPSYLTPGQEGLMEVTLTNVGTDIARDVSVRIFGGRGIISSSFVYIAKIGDRPDSLPSPLGQRSESVLFPMSVDSELEPGTYLMNVTVIYRDYFGGSYHLSELFEVKVSSTKPFIPYFYVAMAVVVTLLALFGCFLYFWKPKTSGSIGNPASFWKSGNKPELTLRKILWISCKVLLVLGIVATYVLLVTPYLIHTNLGNAGVVVHSKEITLESLPEGIQEICRLRRIVTPVLLLVEHSNPEWTAMVIASERFPPDVVVEILDYVGDWRVDWRDFSFGDQTFDRLIIAKVRQLGPLESWIETVLSPNYSPYLGGFLYDVSKLDFYVGPVLLVLCLTLLVARSLALWNIPAVLGCYSFQVWMLNRIAYVHGVYVGLEWRIFGYLFFGLLPVGIYVMWRFEQSEIGRGTAEKLKAISTTLGLAR